MSTKDPKSPKGVGDKNPKTPKSKTSEDKKRREESEVEAPMSRMETQYIEQTMEVEPPLQMREAPLQREIRQEFREAVRDDVQQEMSSQYSQPIPDLDKHVKAIDAAAKNIKDNFEKIYTHTIAIRDLVEERTGPEADTVRDVARAMERVRNIVNQQGFDQIAKRLMESFTSGLKEQVEVIQGRASIAPLVNTEIPTGWLRSSIPTRDRDVSHDRDVSRDRHTSQERKSERESTSPRSPKSPRMQFQAPESTASPKKKDHTTDKSTTHKKPGDFRPG